MKHWIKKGRKEERKAEVEMEFVCGNMEERREREMERVTDE